MSNHSEQINEIAKALALCQGEMSFAVKDSLNPHYKSRYADLSSVWDAIRDPLSKHGLSVSQIMEISPDGKLIMVSMLMHTSGQWIKSVMPIINSNNNMQGLGSGCSYARRYSLAALVGCVQDDDDGEESLPKQSPHKSNKEESKPCISQEKINRLIELIALCDDGYVTKLNKYLLDLGFETYANIPEDKYDLIIAGVNKNVELNKKV